MQLRVVSTNGKLYDMMITEIKRSPLTRGVLERKEPNIMKAMMMNTNLYFAYELLESLLYYFLVLEQRLVFRAKIAFQHVVGLRNGFSFTPQVE